MQIDPEILSADNYTGLRLIPLKNKKIAELVKLVHEHQKEANPILDEMDRIAKEEGMEEGMAQITELQKQIAEIRDRIKPVQDKYQEKLSEVEKIDAKATLIKNKMQPLVDKELEGQLSEFEKPIQVIEKDGEIFVEIQDELEEFIKTKRQ